MKKHIYTLATGIFLAGFATAQAEESHKITKAPLSQQTIILAQSGYICRVPCNSSGNSSSNYDIYKFSVSAGSRSSAKSYALSNHRSLCKSVGLLSVAQPIFCD